ncbi:DNA polymerase III subunit beta [Nonomuraea gerenzanensis]|uniref:DNA polymerase III beta subunit n=1 Tax=Nonomuraea gerenzanensis TaxID=93944 RepID=A0A1M4BL89_9ACTN|nr:DNA polymerase III subunit beta [Nonomuraea gerenzanensis]UBU10007.1 DNA polymerase III subunit beta [Nonomuraea gerenzanensis]SAP16284.1 DNA polymerase III beta subunit [Nonomuraea gerenzanensis]
MKISVEPKLLADTVAWAASVLPNQAGHPILSGIHFEAADGSDAVTISATDNDVSVRATIACNEVAEPGRALLPGRVLNEAVKTLPGRRYVSIAAGERETTFQCGRAEFSLPIMAVKDFPALPEPATTVGSVGAKELAEAVAQVAPATAHHSSTPMYVVVRLAFEGEILTCVGTDSYRIATSRTTWTPARPGPVTAAHAAAVSLRDLLRGFADGEAAIGLNESLLSLTGDGRTATIRLIAIEQYINYQGGMSITFPSWAEADRADLLEAAKRVALFTSKDEAVYLTLTDDAIHIGGGTGQIGKGSDVIDCRFDGDEAMTLKFQPQFLADAISAVHTDRVRIGVLAPHRPCLLASTDEQYRYLCMPLRADS